MQCLKFHRPQSCFRHWLIHGMCDCSRCGTKLLLLLPNNLPPVNAIGLVFVFLTHSCYLAIALPPRMVPGPNSDLT